MEALNRIKKAARQSSMLARFVVAVVIAGGSGCDGGDRSLSGRIVNAATASRGAPVKMSDLTDFAWDRFFLFLPYESSTEIERKLGFSWSRSDMIETSDDFTLLVFVLDKKVVRFVAHPRGPGELFVCRRPGGYRPDEAIIVCPNDEQGRPSCRCQN